MKTDRGLIITSTAKVMSIDLAINEYLRANVQSAGHTMRAKVLDLQFFFEFAVAKFGPRPMLFDITRGSVEDFVEYRLMIEAPATVLRRLATIKHFSRRCADKYSDYKDQLRDVKGPRLDNREPVCLTPKQKEQLRNAIVRADRCSTALRNSIILELGLLQAFRCSEMRDLKLGNIDLNKGLLVNFRGKGTRFSTMRLHKTLQRMVKQYNFVRDDLLNRRFPDYSQLSETEQLTFPYLLSLHNCDLDKPRSFAMDSKTIWKVVSDAGKSCGFDVSPHDLRHTAIKNFHTLCLDPYRTARFARHSSMQTTLLYAQSSVTEIGQTMEMM